MGEFLRKSLSEKVYEKGSVEEGPLERVHRRRFDEESPPKKRNVAERGPVRKVALKPCEEKNNSLIFID